MAEDRTQERTERATPKRRKEAREKGQVPRSRELNTTLVLLAGSIGLVFMGGSLVGNLKSLVHKGLSIERAVLTDTGALPAMLWSSLRDALIILSPLFVLLLTAAVIGPVVLGGWAFSAKAIQPNLGKLNPLKGLGRIFGWRGLMELAKTLAKFAVVTAISGLLLWYLAGELLMLGDEPLRQGLAHVGQLLTWSFLGLSAVLMLIAMIDVPFQLWEHSRELKMTRQEVRDELKETEGRPEVRGRVRQLQREMAQRRMMEEVPRADVVIVNPIHYAVALRFNYQMKAPKVVAKGTDLVAGTIRQLAEQHNVAVFSAPLLARALHNSTKLNQEIPAGLYIAVAQVLAYVYQLKNTDSEQSTVPQPPSDLPVPAEFLSKHIK
jgi:flagellar biosynthetic protein FlhB